MEDPRGWGWCPAQRGNWDAGTGQMASPALPHPRTTNASPPETRTLSLQLMDLAGHSHLHLCHPQSRSPAPPVPTLTTCLSLGSRRCQQL